MMSEAFDDEPQMLDRLPLDTILVGDALATLRRLPPESVHCVISSPPYWGLRDYGTSQVDGGDPDCAHEWEKTLRTPWANALPGPNGRQKNPLASRARPKVSGGYCVLCGATRIDQQLGLESTPDEYVAGLVEVFREARRVLRNDGTLWLNLGDSYAGSGRGGQSDEKRSANWQPTYANHRLTPAGLKPKDLVGIPWRVAFALQADGWWLRSDIVWSKPNPMPESVTDRPTRSHEYLFLLTKNDRYYYDVDAIREPHTALGRPPGTHSRIYIDRDPKHHTGEKRRPGQEQSFHPNGRNRRSVWRIATRPFKEAHFATMPPALVEPCVLAGAPQQTCETCGAPWKRVTRRVTHFEGGSGKAGRSAAQVNATGKWRNGGKAGNAHLKLGPVMESVTIGYRSTCACSAAANTGRGRAVVLDPFMGAGTVGLVARRHSRAYLGIELNPAYAEMATQRIARHGAQPELWSAPQPIMAHLPYSASPIQATGEATRPLAPSLWVDCAIGEPTEALPEWEETTNG